MFTSIDKALAALLGLVIYVLTQFFGLTTLLGIELADAAAVDALIQQTVMFLTPILVWAIPNK